MQRASWKLIVPIVPMDAMLTADVVFSSVFFKICSDYEQDCEQSSGKL